MTVTQVPIGTKTSGRTAWLAPGAAASFLRALADGAPAGGITDAGRTNADQREIYETWLRELSLPLSRRQFKGYAARPGTSLHESGLCLDLAGDTLAWFRQHGEHYGWIKDTVAREKWHLLYVADRDAAKTITDIKQTEAWQMIKDLLGKDPAEDITLEVGVQRILSLARRIDGASRKTAGQVIAVQAQLDALAGAIARPAGVDLKAVQAAARKGADDAVRAVFADLSD